jgi:hypothetical protein
MRRIAVVAVAAALLLTSCGATWYSLPSVRMVAPLYDNAATSCAVAQILAGPLPSASRVVHLRVTQGAWAWQDSMATVAGQQVTFPAIWPPAGGLCTLRAWASDAGGAGCDTTWTRAPVASTLAPARVTVAP